MFWLTSSVKSFTIVWSFKRKSSSDDILDIRSELTVSRDVMRCEKMKTEVKDPIHNRNNTIDE
jgi:hypothetical protein